MKIKKLLALTLALVLAMSVFAACGKKEAEEKLVIGYTIYEPMNYEDENGKSITVRLFFVHPEKTLTRDEVMNVVNSIIDSLAAKGIELKK